MSPLATAWKSLFVPKPTRRKRQRWTGAPVEILLSRVVPAVTPVIGSITTDSGVAGDGVTNDRTLLLTGTAGANETVEVFRDGVRLGSTLANVSGTWTFSMTGTSLADGQYAFTARGTDALGGVSPLSNPFLVTVDGTAPGAPVFTGISDDTGLPGDGVTNDVTLTFSGTAEAGATIRLRRNGVNLGTTVAAADGTWTFHSFTNLADGTHTFTATATDLAGNVSVTSASVSMTIDTQPPPAATITSVLEADGTVIVDGGITYDGRPTVHGTAVPGDTVHIFVDGTHAATLVADALGQWSFRPAIDLGLGLHAIAARTVDVTGNASAFVTSSFTVLLDPGDPEEPDPPEEPDGPGDPPEDPPPEDPEDPPPEDPEDPPPEEPEDPEPPSLPVGVADAYQVAEDSRFTSPTSVLANDTNAVSAQLVSGPSHGRLTFNADGTFTYKPNKNYFGEDSFVYRASDGTNVGEETFVTITVTPVNDAPKNLRLNKNTVKEQTVTEPLTVGKLKANDPDGAANHVYTLVDGQGSADNDMFQIVGDQLQVKPGVVLDYERQSSYTIRLRLSDGEHTVEQVFRIDVKDVKEVKLRVGTNSSGAVDLRQQKVTVAIVSTGSFDATKDVDVNSLTFGRTGTENSVLRQKGVPRTETRDVNGDGRKDLVVTFETAKTGLRSGDTSATLNGAMQDGSLFSAQVAIRTVPASKGKAQDAWFQNQEWWA